MISSVLLSNNFARQLKRLHRAGGSARIVAKHAEAVIQQWVSGEVSNPRQLNRNTRYGEARLKNSFKYDLVEAYRLLAVMDGERLIFLFVGSHDECDQWFYHNKGWDPGLEKKGGTILPVRPGPSPATPEGSDAADDEIAENDFFAEINERDLRLIFSGICRARARPKQPGSLTRSGKQPEPTRQSDLSSADN